MNTTPTGRSRPTETSHPHPERTCHIDDPDALGEMSAVVSPARDTGEERLVDHDRAGDGKPTKLEVSDSTSPIRRKEPNEASDEIPSASNDVASSKSKGLAFAEVIASTPLSRSSNQPMQVNAETQSDVSTVSRHAAPLQHTVAEAQQFEGWQNARMLDRAGQAEMKLGVETAAFGSVRIHTVVRDSQVGLTISGERGNLSPLIAAEMPGVEARLREQDLRIDSVHVYEAVIGSSTSGGSQSDTRDRPDPIVPSRGLATGGLTDLPFDSLTMMPSEIIHGAGQYSSLKKEIMMNVAAASKSSSTGQSDSSTGQVMSDMFMKLLVAQLKSQSPLDPVDPTQFIGQLAQFNSLSELIRIRELLQVPLSSSASTSGTSSK